MTSFTRNIPIILDIISALNPKKVLDVGCGFGKYGILTRELLLSKKAELTGDILPKDDIIIDCAEEAEYFYNQLYHDKIYNNHWHKDIFEMPIEQLNSYDLILLIDVVEHWDKEDAKKWLSKIKTKVLISTPKKVSYYREHYYKCRKHISQWEDKDFKGDNHSNNLSFIYLKK